MRVLLTSAFIVASLSSSGTATQRAEPTPTGTLLAAYLSGNPAQAVTDPAAGTPRGVAVDLAHDLGRRLGRPVTMTGLPSPQHVIDAVRSGQADIGFVAYNPERAGPVAFSQPYMLVHQTFLVAQSSPIRSVADIDRANQRIGAGKGDSIALYLARTLTAARLVEVTEPVPNALEMVREGTLDAFGANRQRLSNAMQSARGLRLLPDDLYGVEQTIIVPVGKSDLLSTVNQFIDDARRSGFLRQAIERSGVIGVAVAPPPSK